MLYIPPRHFQQPIGLLTLRHQQLFLKAGNSHSNLGAHSKHTQHTYSSPWRQYKPFNPLHLQHERPHNHVTHGGKQGPGSLVAALATHPDMPWGRAPEPSLFQDWPPKWCTAQPKKIWNSFVTQKCSPRTEYIKSHTIFLDPHNAFLWAFPRQWNVLCDPLPSSNLSFLPCASAPICIVLWFIHESRNCHVHLCICWVIPGTW